MATHNGQQYIKKQLSSILHQLSVDDEVIISDDGSTDDTITIINSFNDSRIQLYIYKQSVDYSHRYLCSYYYATSNFGNALRYAKGDIIFLADQDDIWEDNKVSLFIKQLKDADFVTSNFSIIDENDVLIEEAYYKQSPYQNLNIFKVLSILPFRGCCSAFKREVLVSALPFPKYLFLHDCWIGLNAYLSGKHFAFINSPLLLYRRHSENVSDLESPNSFYFKILYRLTLIAQMVKHRFYPNL